MMLGESRSQHSLGHLLSAVHLLLEWTDRSWVI
jgi:hypothetical protein